MTSFISDFFTKPVTPNGGAISGHGGARRGAGAKTNEEREPGSDYAEYNKAKTREMQAKAGRQEIELAKELGEVVMRTEVANANAKAFAAIAQSCRSIPDILERQFGFQPAVIEKVSELIDVHLAQLSESLRKVHEAKNEHNPND